MEKPTTATFVDSPKNHDFAERGMGTHKSANRPSSAGTPASPATGWEIVVGTIIGLAGPSEPLVRQARDLTGAPLRARAVVSVTEKDVGRQAVLAFEDGDLAKPIVMGLIQNASAVTPNVTVSADGEKFLLLAEREIELRCGEASITLTRAGKVLIKGEYVLTRAKGLNRIKGAAVSIN